MRRVTFNHTGSRFDLFLRDAGMLEDAEAVAVKRVIAWKLEQAMKARRMSKQSMARQLRTSRSQLDRLLDPTNIAVSLNTITRAARAVGKRVKVSLTDLESRGREPHKPVARRSKGKRDVPVMR